jgi:hypothetical protein
MDDGQIHLPPMRQKLATDRLCVLIVAATTPIGHILKSPLHIDKEKDRHLIMQGHFASPSNIARGRYRLFQNYSEQGLTFVSKPSL